MERILINGKNMDKIKKISNSCIEQRYKDDIIRDEERKNEVNL